MEQRSFEMEIIRTGGRPNVLDSVSLVRQCGSLDDILFLDGDSLF